ncbi:NACHT domain-containing NTPase [Nostocaceae cyanobacterium CENA369]|uniref:NACHT domain-containing NTPase n=1 Tax=Dendronalium phyllosphericum CENA369 TaxID=1725256 RepID=A0A8J7LI63_9NOST|nr:NACHT domain-containing NTPase [Dendronalium phyllosphericum]MBH8576778.1 NACHT domain-containing NTPase [Dendronalium phyllosphericum CENA369]
MAERSLQASQKGIQLAKQALISKRLLQKDLIGLVCQSRQPISKFFTGKPCDREIFVGICERLSLKWQDIAEMPPVDDLIKVENNTFNTNALVKEVREKIKPLIEERCGTMRVLDMTQPIGLNDIYTNVNILEKITGRRWLGIDELLQQCTNDDFDRFGLSRITEKRVPGLEAVEKYPKLMILGKPGAGKTTFLKYLAMQCIGGEFQSKRVPIFVTLKNFAEAANKPGLLEYLIEDTIKNISNKPPFVETEFIYYIQDVITHGKALILLDGLDEVREEDNSRILKEIGDFSEHFRKNHFVITCRIAAREYIFDKFIEVEVADFDNKQIKTFATNWFKDKAVKPETFLERLEDNNRIKQLAASPLLLTLLCLAFEESGDFPANRSELYKEGLDALLKKWDAKRGIQRDQVYKKLSVQRKEDLLSKIALTTFELGDYFFKQKTAERYITQYIRNLPGANTDEEALQVDSEEVLRSIEYHHGLVVARAKGIYSFSHLTFHEYFTAREFVVVRQSSEEALQNLVSHVTEKRWREVFLLAVGMSPSADRLLLLIKQQVDLLIDDDELLGFLNWVNHKSLSVEIAFNPLTVRAFYINLCSDLELNLTNHLAEPEPEPEPESGIDYSSVLNSALLASLLISNSTSSTRYFIESELRPLSLNTLDFEIDDALISALAHAHKLASNTIPQFQVGSSLAFTLNRAISIIYDNELKRSLRRFKQQIPDPKKNRAIFKTLWKANGKAWLNKLKLIIIDNRNIGYEWNFSDEQKDLIKQYYDANRFLVDCLNSDCYVSREVRQQIEDTLLLPIAEIQKRQQQS